jgi:alkylation response protein AidB-like acyl-CoA dehydrogenase
MDFTFSEEQETIATLARDLFERRATRLTELESRGTRYDSELWRELAAADLLGVALSNCACCWPRSGGAWLRRLLIRHCCWAPIRSPGTAMPSNSSGFCPG